VLKVIPELVEGETDIKGNDPKGLFPFVFKEDQSLKSAVGRSKAHL
jgi:hypothetical protein